MAHGRRAPDRRAGKRPAARSLAASDRYVRAAVTDSPRPPRVLHVTWRLSQTGGIPGVIRALIEHNQPDRCEVHVATIRPALAEDRLEELAGRAVVHPLGFEGPLSPFDRVRASMAVARLQQRTRADLIHAHSGTAWLTVQAAMGSDVRQVLDVHDAPGSGRHGALTDRFEGWMIRRRGFVPVVHSTSVRGDVARMHRVRLQRAVLIPLGIATGDFGGTYRGEVDDGRPVVLYVARVVPSKNVDLFLDLAATIGPRARFVVVGDGSELVRLKARVAAEHLGEHVELVGPLVGEPLADWYRRADIFVSTSTYEGFGLAVVEAMAASTPVIAVAVGGVTDLVVEGETGYLVPLDDPQALHTRLKALLDDPDARARMGSAGQARAVARFDVSGMVEAYLDAYDQILLGAQ